MPAPKVFEGIGINPMERIPFADQFPFFQDPANPTNATTLIKQPDALLPSREGLSTIPLTDFILNRQDLMYYGQLGLGSNRQTMSFDIDTGSADLWAISNCDGCPSSEQYDISTSTTYKDLDQYFSVTYVSVHCLRAVSVLPLIGGDVVLYVVIGFRRSGGQACGRHRNDRRDPSQEPSLRSCKLRVIRFRLLSSQRNTRVRVFFHILVWKTHGF